MIELIWIESELAETPVVEKESFGTQFIRTLIERQLHGKWQRQIADRQLSVYIRWQESAQPT